MELPNIEAFVRLHFDPLQYAAFFGALVVLGLIATGVTVIWRDVAGHSGELVPQTASPQAISPYAASQGGLGQPSVPTAQAGSPAGAGLRLLSEAARACQHVSYQGVQRTAWQGPGGSWISLVNVWHERDRQTLIQAATMPADALPLPAGATPTEGASCFVNPLTALGMVETMRREGHKALVHTAAASNLGQMLVKICLEDGVDLVNIVRSAQQAKILTDIGAKYVVDSSAANFQDALTDALAAIVREDY